MKERLVEVEGGGGDGRGKLEVVWEKGSKRRVEGGRQQGRGRHQLKAWGTIRAAKASSPPPDCWTRRVWKKI